MDKINFSNCKALRENGTPLSGSANANNLVKQSFHHQQRQQEDFTRTFHQNSNPQQQYNNSNLKDDVYEVILRKYEEEKKQHLQQIQFLSQKLKLKEENLDRVMGALENMKEENTKLTSERDRLASSNETLNAKLNSSMKSETMNDIKIRDAIDQRLQLQLSCNKLIEKNEKSDKKLLKLKMEKHQLANQVEQLTKDLKIMSEKANCQNLLEILKKDFASLMMMKKDLERELKMKDIQLAESESTLSNSKNQLKDAINENNMKPSSSLQNPSSLSFPPESSSPRPLPLYEKFNKLHTGVGSIRNPILFQVPVLN
ncbi:hypothetical protein HELRODRAFT_167464 [Helobdella robusta]|uniref:Uncharacterized protein n=1 Tax=Helobdella robusta TaxID=6412 RepID=T1EZE7_HELRO|nr:hypothetical protein HELRODRAFT_167464 [Helobdella robusta]ESO10950.1 hypothetical protein HELRODRAFT_167464 [Helobdella robusta]